mgnify:CR=1 FL=1
MGGDSSDGSSKTFSPFSIVTQSKKIFIAENGRIEIKTVYKDKNDNIIEQSEKDKISVSYSIERSDIAQITDTGFLLGKKSGTTELTATLTHDKEVFSDTVTVSVEPLLLQDLYINPTVNVFEKEGASKDFTITATESDGAGLKLYKENISFVIDKPSLIEDPKLLFTDDTSKVIITAKNTDKNNFDYTFVTPYYNKGNIKVQGNPTLIQFKATPQPNSPNGSEGGEHISLLTTNSSDIKTIYHALHSDGYSKLYYQRYDAGKWGYYVLSPEGVFGIEDTKMIEKDDALYIVAATNKGIYEAIIDLKESSIEAYKNFVIQDIKVSSVDVEVIDSLTYYTYFDETNKKLMMSIVNSQGKVQESITLSTSKEVKSFDIALNLSSEFRAVLYDGASVFYITNQNGTYYQEEVLKSRSIDNLKLLFDRANKPYVLMSKSTFDGEILVYSKGSVGNRLGVWKSKSITKEHFNANGFKDSYSAFDLDNINSIDAHFDFFNALRIVVGEDDDVYMIKEYLYSPDSADWRIDRIAEGVGAKSVATSINDRNRLSIMYSYDQNDWIRLWDEPAYLKYGDKTPKNNTGSDLIEEIDSNKLQ